MKKLFTFLFFLSVTSFLSAQYYSENFDAGLPADWTLAGDWVIGTPADNSSQAFPIPAGDGSNLAVFNDDGLGNGVVNSGILTTGAIDLTAVTGTVWLEMQSFFPNLDYQGDDEVAIIRISTDMGVTWAMAADLAGGEALGGGEYGVAFADLSAFAGQTIWLQFDYDDGGGWNYGWAFDNINIGPEITLLPARSFGLHAGGAIMMDDALDGLEYINSGFIYNRGLETITSYDIVMTNGTETITSNVTGVNIEYNETVRYTATEAIVVSGSQEWTVSLENVNGTTDPDDDMSDNSMSFNLNAVTNIDPNKGVVVEEATGTWCTWCPRGTVFLDEMAKRFGKHFVGVAVHNGDPMVLGAYDSAITSFPGFQGFPSVIYQRESILDPSAIVNPSLADMQNSPPAKLVIGAAMDGSDLTTSLEVQFLEDVTGADYSISIVLTEDGLTGTTSDWAQINAYSGGGNGPMGGFEILGGAVSAELMVYDHVGRALIGGYEGVADTIVGDFFTDDITGYIFDSYTVPAEYVMDNMHINGFLINGQGEIVNAISTTIGEAVAEGLFVAPVSTDDVYDNNLAQVNPNPVRDMANITMSLNEASDVRVSVMNALGQQVSSMNYGTMSGSFNLEYNMSNLAAGVYYMHIQADDKFMSKKITVVE